MTEDGTQSQTELVEALRNPDLYPHEVDSIQIIETHISWLVFTGRYAYKIKKAVELGFLDFSTLALRREFCFEEVRLNRRTAPDMYLAVVPITGSTRQPELGGGGEPIEYAVRMRQFPADALLSDRLAQGRLTSGEMDDLAALVARFHARAAVARPDGPYGTPAAVFHPIEENLRHIAEQPGAEDTGEALARIRGWNLLMFDRLQPVIARRLADGFVRECHGDLHLGNIASIDGQPTPFDCIEFNPYLRWIDVISEIAFLVMDLEDRGRRDLGDRFLNDYLEHTGDYGGLQMLRFYMAYRAMVRAKVAGIRLGQSDLDPDTRKHALGELHEYIALALSYTEPARPFLAITHGLSGSGKSWCSRRMVGSLGAIRIRSDVERKRLFGLAPGQCSGSTLEGGIYTTDANRRTYERLANLAESAVAAGFGTIVDATFLRRDLRQRFEAVARHAGVPFRILDFRADAETLRARVRRRAESGGDASEADLAVLDRQLATAEPLTDDERHSAIVIDSDESMEDAAAALAAL